MSADLDPQNRIELETAAGYSLAETIAPVAWGRGRWPNQDWIDGRLIAVSTDARGPVIRVEEQPASAEPLLTLSSNRPDLDLESWAISVLGIRRAAPPIPDPVVQEIAFRFPGMRPFSNGNLFDGVVTAIVGQSISVQAAAVTERTMADDPGVKGGLWRYRLDSYRVALTR